MLRSNGDPVRSPHRQASFVAGRVVGAAAANPTVPTDTRGDNNVLSTNRTGVGVFTVTFKKEVNLAVILAVNVSVIGPTGEAHVSSYTPGTATTGAIVGIRFTTDAGVAAEATTNDTIHIQLVGRDSAT